MPATPTSSVAVSDTDTPPSAGTVLADEIGGTASVKSNVLGPRHLREARLPLERRMEVVTSRDIIRSEWVAKDGPSSEATVDVRGADLAEHRVEGDVALLHH